MLVDGALVRAQLRYCGMLETIRVRQSGASYRIRFEDVVQRYRVLLSDKDRRSGAPAIKLAQLILAKLPADCADKWQFGKTKVFMKNIVNAALERMRAELIISTVVLVQSFVRMAVYRLRYLKKQKSAQVIQQAFREHQVVKKRNAKANSVAKIQARMPWR